MKQPQVNVRKKQRRIEFLWNKLVKFENFLIPKTIEDLKEFGFMTPSIKINKAEYFFKKEVISLLNELTDEIYDTEEIKNHVSYNTVYRNIKTQIQDVLLSELNGISKRFSDIYPLILERILSERKNYEFFWNVKGVSLVDLSSVSFGNAFLFKFNADDTKYVESFVIDNQDHFQETIKSFLEQNFINKTCIKCQCNGDLEFSKNRALNDAQRIINILRFMFCYLYPEYVYHNKIKINLIPETMVGRDESMSINLDDKSITLHWDSRKSTYQDYPISQDLINGFKQYYFWDSLISIFGKNQKTELEEAIANAIYWIGEAQNEWTPQVAFIKFWTAIEALTYTLPEKDKVTDAVLTGTSTLLVNGGYHFIAVDEYWHLRRNLNKLYEKRSLIIHRGLLEKISHQNITDICKYSTWMVLGVLGLRSIGYSTFEQIRAQAERLHKIHMRGKGKLNNDDSSTV